MPALFLTLALGTSAAQLPAAALSEPSIVLEQGRRQMHDLDYVRAIASFRQVQRLDPENPAGYYYEAATAWLRELDRREDLNLGRFLDASYFDEKNTRPRDEAAEKTINSLLTRARVTAVRRLQKDPADPDTLYYLGLADALRAGFESTVRHATTDALRSAKIAFTTHRKLLNQDPEYFDAYLPVGLHDYAAGSLPFVVKWVAFLSGYRGQKNHGIKQIELAAERGPTARRDAQVCLSIIYVREGRFDDALELLVALKRRAPHNHILRLNEAFCLSWLGRYLEAADIYREAIDIARPDARLDREATQVLEAKSALLGGSVERAIGILQPLLSNPAIRLSVRTTAHLVLGEAYDTIGKRKEAIEQYVAVIRAKPGNGVRDEAMKHLEEPFHPPGLAPATATTH